MMFWIAAALLVALCLAAMLAPMIRGIGTLERRASYDMQIFRDQIREVERDVARGVVTPAEAEATRTEIARKLLAAAEAEKREAAACRAPRRASLVGGALTGAAVLALTGWLYSSQGSPGYPDQPLSDRVARAQAAVEETARIVEQLREAVAANPEDVQGHRFLARELFRLGRLAEAVDAQRRVLALLGDEAAATDYLMLAQLEFGAASGHLSPAAESALTEALARDPENPLARYFWGLKLLGDGKPEETRAIWSELVEEGPSDAPWVLAILQEMDAVVASPAPEDAAAPSPGPVEIEQMVASLGARLAETGGTAEEWAQLIRSLGVLGRIAKASAIYKEAQTAFASDPAALALLRQAAEDARLLR